MCDGKDIERSLFKVVKSIGALQHDLDTENVPRTRRCTSTLKDVGDLENLSDITISSFEERHAVINFERSFKLENGL